MASARRCLNGKGPTDGRALGLRQTWAFIVAKFMTDPVWWFFLIWLPDYFNRTRGLRIKDSWVHLVTIYTIVTILSIAGGWLTGHLNKAGWSVTRARKAGMFLFALCVLPIIGVTRVGDWPAVLLIGLAAAAHQGWSANIFTIASDMFPKRAVGSIVGLGGMAGAAGGLLFSPFIGFVLERTHNNYLIPFLVSGSVYLLAFAIIQALAPRLEPAALDRPHIRPAPAPASRP